MDVLLSSISRALVIKYDDEIRLFIQLAMKKSLRQNALALRRQLSAETMKMYEKNILASVHTLLYSRAPCTVGLYYPTQGEPNLLQICGASSLGGCVWGLPVCVGSGGASVLRFSRYALNHPLVDGRYGIPVPAVEDWVEPDVLLIPCVAFHREGGRLGYGAGWYDRTLAAMRKPVLTVGIALAETEVFQSFAEPHDRLLDYLVTERELFEVVGKLSISHPNKL